MNVQQTLDHISILREMAELAYDGRHPSVSMRRAAALSAAVDEITLLRARVIVAEQQARFLASSVELPTEDSQMAVVREHMRHSRRVSAVKLYREIHGCGLKEAIVACDALVATST